MFGSQYQESSFRFIVSLVGKTQLQARFIEQLPTATCGHNSVLLVYYTVGASEAGYCF